MNSPTDKPVWTENQPSIDGTPVLQICFAAPGRLNALSLEILNELTRNVRKNRDKLLVISSSSESKYFSVGLDKNDLYNLEPPDRQLQALKAVFQALLEHELPTASLVHGPALAGGIGLAVCPHITILASHAYFSLPGAAEYEPLADILFPIVSACRQQSTKKRLFNKKQFDKWYKAPATSTDLYKSKIAQKVVHTLDKVNGEAFLMNAARDALAEHLRNDDKHSRNYTLHSKKWRAFESLLVTASGVVKTARFQHSLHRELHIKRDKKNEKHRKQVFLVHGRNLLAKDAMVCLLEHMGLIPLDWNAMISEADTPKPYFVVAAGLKKAQAMVVLLTGDDKARLRKRLRKPDEANFERKKNKQPRQNVLVEVGMGLGICEHRTILVELGSLRPVSDTDALRAIRVTSNHKWYDELKDALKRANCIIDEADQTALLSARHAVEKRRWD